MNKLFVRIAATLLLVFVMLMSVGMTLASWKISSPALNIISMGSVTGKIIEVFEEGQTVYPASEINKEVRVKNTGSADVFARVKIDKAWGDQRDNDGLLIKDTDLSTENIIINYNSNNWLYNEEDGYYYYLGVLKPNNTTEPLFESFVVDGKTTDSSYNSKQADITVSMELVQAAGNGLSYWSITSKELGVVYTPNTHSAKATAVAFENPTNGFSFKADNTDLFANFKNLMPGESRNQEIEISNKYSSKVSIYLYAQSAEQSGNEEEKELIDKLLKKYAVISIADDKGTEIYNGPVWGNLDVKDSDEKPNMKYEYLIGEFSPSETKKINVSLYLDSQMDNKYRSLLGRVNWVFSAQGDEDSPKDDPKDDPKDSSTDTPRNDTKEDWPQRTETNFTEVIKTGDLRNTVIYMTVAILSLIMIAVINRKKNTKAENA